MKTYNLSDSYIIVSYPLDSDEEISIEPTKHGNAKKLDTEDFLSTMHSVKQTLKEAVQNDPYCPLRFFTDSLATNNIFETDSDGNSVRNSQQISNYLQYYGKKEHKVEDDIQSIILDVLQQGKDKNIEVNDKDQPFIQEVLIRNGKQVSIVAFLKATIDDTSRFCANDDIFSALSIDTTFNIAECYITETAFKYLSIVHKDSSKHPWFPRLATSLFPDNTK